MLIGLELLFIGLIGLNLFWLHSVWLGLPAIIILVTILARRSRDPLYTMIASLSWLIIVGSFFYYTYKLNSLTIFIAILSLPVIFHWIKFNEPPREKKENTWLAVMALGLGMLLLLVLLGGRTGESIISPWPQVSSIFFILLFGLLAISFIGHSGIASTTPIIAAWSVALVIYKNGFGFDAFTHQAAEQYIKLHGLITPKTFYYIGHYALAIITNAATGLSLPLFDSLLVPTLMACLVGLTAYRTLGKYTALILFLPFTYSIVTTPFAFALMLFVILLFLEIQNAPRWLKLILALSTFCIHPIVGVPALFSVVWFDAPNIKLFKSVWKQILLALVGLALLPILFLIVGQFSPHTINITWPVIFERRYDFWLDLIQLFSVLIIPTIVLGGLIITFRHHRRWLIAFLIVGASGLLIKTLIIFPNLISYEQDSFADRTLFLSLFFLFIPLAIFLKEKISAFGFPSRFIKILFFSLLAIFLIFSVYLSYPRKDIYDVSKGWSMGEADLMAVEKIEADANGSPYIVLANQATSAAALKTFGFRYIKASNDEFFFYPIPTSGRLYQYYLDIVYSHQNRAALEAAIHYANVKLGYFAVSNYWWDAAKIKKDANLWADSSFDIEQGKVTVFKVYLK